MIQISKRRRTAAVVILQNITCGLDEDYPSKVIGDEWYKNLYRMAFAVRVDGGYYPGGPAVGQAERHIVFGSVEDRFQVQQFELYRLL